MDLEQRLAHSFLRHDGGLGPVVEIVHPDDDMYRYLRAVEGIRPSERALTYFRSGREATDVLAHLLSSAERSLTHERSVLEFACGFGRGTRFLARAVAPGRLTVSDVLPGSVEFLESHFGVRGFRSQTDPAAAGTRGPFSLILVVSLFSHLPEARFHAWLQRLGSWLEDDGLLVLTTHGAPPSGASFHFVPASESATLESSEYGSTWVDADFVAEAAARAGLSFHRHLERELGRHQDVHVLSRRTPAVWHDWTPCPRPRGRIDRLTTEGRRALLEGWAANVETGEPARSVEVLFDDRSVGPVGVGIAREDVARFHDDPRLAPCGWQLLTELPELPESRFPITVRAPGSSGVPRVVDVAELVVDGEGRCHLER